MNSLSPSRAFCRPNLVSQEILPDATAPWLNQEPIPQLPSKEAYRAWCANPNTKHLFFTLVEGEVPGLPLGSGNRPHRVHGFIADYDTTGVEEHDFARMLSRCNPQFQPYAWNITFSGGARVIWLFEEPIFYFNPPTYRRFVSRLKRELKLTSLFAGFDESCEQAGRYYTAGNGWKINDRAPRIRSATLHLWQAETSRDADFDSGVEIPLDLVAAEVEKRFPGRWTGEFREGARGVRFWDPTGDAHSAIVRKTGMQAFTGSDGFLSWERLFGREFIQQYLEDRLGAAIRDIYYDGKQYYRELPDERWDAMGTDTAKRHLAVRYGLCPRAGKDENESECDRALNRIELSKRVSGALPFPHFRQRVVEYNGENYINTATTRYWPAALDPQDWGENFPWIASYLSNLFDEPRNLEVFLAWLHVWITAIHNGTPRKGQAVFLVGPPGTGKTLLSTQILGRMVGGFTEATKFIVEGNRYNDSLFHKALWTIDDAIPGSDRDAHARFSAMVKAIAANGTFRYEKKFGGSHDMPAFARLFVTLNEDPESLMCLPNADMSLMDKIILLRTGELPADVAYDPAERFVTIERELQYFVRWVLDYEIPSWIEKDARYGIKAYHEAELLREAREVTPSATIVDVLDLWRREHHTSHPDQDEWCGTSTELAGMLRNYECTAAVASRLNLVWIGRLVNQAINNGVTWLSRRRPHANRGVFIVIDLKDLKEAQ